MEHYSTWRTCARCNMFTCPGQGQQERACKEFVALDDDDFDDGEYERKQVAREQRYLDSL